MLFYFQALLNSSTVRFVLLALYDLHISFVACWAVMCERNFFVHCVRSMALEIFCTVESSAFFLNKAESKLCCTQLREQFN